MHKDRTKGEMIYNGFSRLRGELLTFFLKWNFGQFGKGSILYKPLRIDGMKNIFVGDNVIIRHLSWFYVQGNESTKVVIGDGCYLGHFFHCAALGEIKIGKKVLFADKVFITDNAHGFQNVEMAYMDNPMEFKENISIGDGSWIGENVCILSASVGSHCIVGSNSVVTSSIPDYCVAVGSPAKVIKRYDHQQQEWVKV